MFKNIKLLVLMLVSNTLLVSCFNMPTPPSQITGSYTSSLKYEKHDCSRLGIEINSLARRENQLIVAQEQRVSSSQNQAFWLGFGNGDGIEASELANVRGEKEAVRKAMEIKKCEELHKFNKEEAKKKLKNSKQKASDPEES